MPRMRKHAATAVGAAMAAAALAGAVPASASSGRQPARVVVTTGDDASAARIGKELRAHGARHLRALPVVHGFSADVPGAYVDQLRRVPGVRSVTVDTSVKLLAINPDLGYDPQADFGSLYDVTRVVQAQDVYANGIAGRGIDVALIDSGVAPVQGLTSGNVVNGPDLSFESQSADLQHLDTFGHGTHMASIIAGRDVAQTATAYAGDQTHFNGVAPNSRIVSVKVADHSGATDVSQVIAAIDWVVAHKTDNGMNIRVLNLSFGTDSLQSPQLDPLCFAVENAWRKGIVVVAAGGNEGKESGGLANPAQDPFIIAVGADDPMNTVNVSDDVVPAFSSKGNSTRRVDVVAPAVHILGLRNPGSAADQQFPSARVGTRFFRGSGTSQAAAVVSGAVALLLQRYPTLTPDQVKKHLNTTATPFDGSGVNWRGNGVVNIKRAVNQAPPTGAAAQSATPGTGTGSLEASRGSYHVADATSILTGEKDIFGNAFDSTSWAALTTSGNAWNGGTWNGASWTGNAWNSTDWTGNAWNGASWTGNAWNGNAWNDSSWTGHAWNGNAWNGNAWNDSAWSGNAWNGASWTGNAWNGASWTGASWTGNSWSSSAWSSSVWE